MGWTEQQAVRALQVIVSVTTAGQGVFVYSGTPGSGNPPIASVTSGTKDPFGNTVVPGIVSYNGAAYAQLATGELVFVESAGQYVGGAVSVFGEGGLSVTSGEVSSTDGEAQLLLLSAQNFDSGGVSRASLVAEAVQLDSSASATIPVAAVSGFPLPDDTNSGTGWVSGERAFMNDDWIAPINALYSALVSAGIIA